MFLGNMNIKYYFNIVVKEIEITSIFNLCDYMVFAK